jgi:phospholipase/carboxylesterase/glyoxalase family protein
MMADVGVVHRFVPAHPESGGEAAGSSTLLMLHGSGGDETDLIDLGSKLLPGASILSPRGKVMEHGMPRFFRRLADGVFDLEDLKLRTRELAGFIEEAKRAYRLRGNIIAVGYSNGANIAAGLILLHPGILARAILFRAMVPLVPDGAPNLNGTRVLLARRDHIASPTQTLRLFEVFQTAGADVDIHWHEGGHELGQDDIDAARKWVARPDNNRVH